MQLSHNRRSPPSYQDDRIQTRRLPVVWQIVPTGFQDTGKSKSKCSLQLGHSSANIIILQALAKVKTPQQKGKKSERNVVTGRDTRKDSPFALKTSGQFVTNRLLS
jgi:hypothetical protein